MKNILKPKEIADLLGMPVESLVDIDVDRVSSDSLNKLSRSNPKKYNLQMLGVVCFKLNISIEELVLYSKQRDEILKLLKE
ncbi:MAG: hypothetical protein QG567_943 [Campylobacterota bacterium]|nr:hypothetical protein [Campylobacterota bacterium]